MHAQISIWQEAESNWQDRNCTCGDMGEHLVLSLILVCKPYFPKDVLVPARHKATPRWRTWGHQALQPKQASHCRDSAAAEHPYVTSSMERISSSHCCAEDFLLVSVRALGPGFQGLIPTKLSSSISEVFSEAAAITTMGCTSQLLCPNMQLWVSTGSLRG